MARDLVSGLFWLAVALFAVVQGHALKLGTLGRPGPGFFPFWGGVVLTVLSLLLLVGALRKRDRSGWPAIGSPKLLVVMAALLGYVVLLEPLGFVIVTFLFLLLLVRLGGRRWASSGVAALLGTLGAYALFQLWLKTQLPSGPLGF
jgi:putative tricarboxylic transport membrane protein